MRLTKDASAFSPGTSEEEIESAQAILDGLVVALPTETVWGMSARWDDEQAVNLLYERKGREPGKPVQLLCATPEAALAFVAAEDEAIASRLARFWPGPLTVVVRAQGLPGWMAPGGTVGLRVPDSPTTQRVLALLPGQAAAATSVNLAGEPPAATEAEVREQVGRLIDRVHRGPPAEGLSSSVYLAAEHRLAREGAISLAQVEAALREET